MTNQPVLQRDSSRRVAAGVCAGLARQLHVDPMVVRLFFIVGTIVSNGLGVLIYLVLWAVMPTDAFPLRRPRVWTPTRTLLFVGLVVVGAGVLFPASRGMLVGLALVAVIAVVWFASARNQPRPVPPGPASHGGNEQYYWHQPPNVGGGRAAPQPIRSVLPYPPLRRPRTWRWVLLGLAASWLCLGVASSAGVRLGPAAYWAAALAVIGLTLVIVARPERAAYGRPRGLVASGLVASLVTTALMLPAADGAPVASGYRAVTRLDEIAAQENLPTGSNTIDLSGLSAGTDATVSINQDAGRLVIVLPQHMNTVAHCEVGVGEIATSNGTRSGLDPQTEETFAAPGAEHTLTLRVRLEMGQLEVRR